MLTPHSLLSRSCQAIAAMALGFGMLSSAKADENMFGYTYGADTLPKGKWEFYNWTTWRHDKHMGEYDALDIQFELEYGITDRFQTSTYLMFDWRDQSGLDPEEYSDINDFRFDGLKQAFKYNVMSAYKDSFGLSFYIEPGWSRFHKITGERIDEFEIETKIIIQKNFFDDTLIWALNLTPEFEWYFPDGSPTETEFIFEATTGLSYRIAPNWYVGIESRYHTEFPEYGAQEHQAVFLGPNLHYGGKKWWATLSVMPQLWGEPNDEGTHRHFGEHEAIEVRLKVGYNF